MKTSKQYSNGYLQCLIDLKGYINEVSSESDEPPTIEEIIRDFIKPLKSKYKKRNAMGVKISNSEKCSEETQATVSKTG